MSRPNDLLATITGIGAAFDTFQKTATERIAAIRKDVDALTDADTGQIAELRSRLEEVESRINQPGRVSAEARDHRGRQSEHMRRFTAWLRRPTDQARAVQLSEFQSQHLETKDVSIGTPSAGGFAVPEEISRDIERLELKFSPVRSLVKVIVTSTSDYKELVSIRGATSGWVGEADSRTKTDTSLLRERAPTHGELYAYPQASNWSLDDVFFDVGQWLAEEAAQAFAVQEADAVIRGDGSNKPTGIFNTTPVATPDFASPLRSANAIEYIASASLQSPAVAEIDPDKLIDLVYAVNSAYRANGTWAMNSRTAGVIRKLKDDNGQYLWAPGLIAGQPDRLLGYPVSIWEALDDIGANAFPILFGDFRRAYVIADRPQGTRILLDQVTSPGFSKFYIRRREGGCLLNNDAIKALRTTVS